MTKISILLKKLLPGLALLLSISSFAVVPQPTALPCTLNVENNLVFLNIDGDETIDYEVRYEYNEGAIFCDIVSPSFGRVASGELSGFVPFGTNFILSEPVEYRPTLKDPKPGELTAKIKGFPFSRIMSKGNLVGDQSLYGIDAGWIPFSMIYSNDFNPVGGNALQANSYEDGVMSGYLGLYFDINGQMHYGWINVEIGPGGEWVVLKSSGY
ncbi:MAG TPA: hypothetical protein PLF35_12755, partial [Prolixibacteraceae bacterium]|nr:hypothetical protein [Prolixibacteraceae bacterium]